ncbi:ribonuclease P protein component [Rudaeicoccus suwonensis]|uniref:Ribonuclease P protein component n=1 Tax=Rudaeicoccus suwonensis TaxID=657409 RepID=A0A561E3Z8_9MICO|nr:ribonuclease P protein component [Rudaeicoccus suwonensis]TWE10344.1 ribonuclease P protein component [Rudaeicoccus suwonensis]
MLPSTHRLRDSADFSAVLRSRRSGRAASQLLVVSMRDTGNPASRVGLIVSKAVGNAVVRGRTKRVLRHLMAARISDLPIGTDVVIRANPAAAAGSSAMLGAELDRLLPRALDASR